MVRRNPARILHAALFVLISYGFSNRAFAQQSQQRIEYDLNTMLMKSTFLVQSVPTQGTPLVFGTAFVMGRPWDHPPTDKPNLAAFVLITANHVLEGLPGDTAILNLRQQLTNGDWAPLPWVIQIRNNGQPVWIKHPSADVAAMYVSLPDAVKATIPLISTDLLADDASIEKFGMHPGDNLGVLGFPFGIKIGAGGFPILRSGRIASYPLLPTDKVQTFLLDFSTFKGNSGGPVYLAHEGERFVQGQTYIGARFQLIMGLVSQELTQDEHIIGAYKEEIEKRPLGLAVIVQARYIKDALGMLPKPDVEFPNQ